MVSHQHTRRFAGPASPPRDFLLCCSDTISVLILVAVGVALASALALWVVARQRGLPPLQQLLVASAATVVLAVPYAVYRLLRAPPVRNWLFSRSHITPVR